MNTETQFWPKRRMTRIEWQAWVLEPELRDYLVMLRRMMKRV